MIKRKIRKGDTVKVISGSDRGHVGEVLEVLPAEGLEHHATFQLMNLVSTIRDAPAIRKATVKYIRPPTVRVSIVRNVVDVIPNIACMRSGTATTDVIDDARNSRIV